MLKKIILATLVCSVPAAWAHITLQQQSAAAGSNYKAVFSVPHGCDGSATKAITVTLPAGVSGVQAQPKSGWALEIKTEAARTSQITWSGGSLPATQGDSFVAQLTLPDTAGKLYFRVLQTCEKGQTDWAEIPADGAAKAKSPAPMLEVIRAYTVGKIRISHPWARATVPAQTTGGAFLTLENGGAADKLLSVSANVATAELHSMSMNGNVMTMKKLDGLDLPAGKTVELSPGAFHIMLTQLKGALKQGTSFPLKLKFEKAGEVTVDVQVEAMTSSGAPAAEDHEHMRM